MFVWCHARFEAASRGEGEPPEDEGDDKLREGEAVIPWELAVRNPTSASEFEAVLGRWTSAYLRMAARVAELEGPTDDRLRGSNERARGNIAV